MKSHVTAARLALVALAAGALIQVGGCSDDSGGSVNAPPLEQQIDLNAPNGGFTSIAEEPAFGDAGLAAEVAAETEFADQFAEDPEIREMQTRQGSRFYVLTALWGQVTDSRADDLANEDGTDYEWSGRMELSRGALLLRSTISFEPEDGDSITRRSVPGTLVWTSFTGKGMDGLRVLIVVPPSDNRPGQDGPDSLYFRAGNYERAFDVRSLEDLEDELVVDEFGNRIVFTAWEAPNAVATNGFLRGRWEQIAEGDSVGRFSGVWVAQNGRTIGLFRGIYGVDDGGKQVFYGKYIDPHGNFLGILRGIWTQVGVESWGSTRETVLGRFRGEWVNEGNARQGELQGRWAVTNDRPGVLRGRWCTGDCLPG